MGEIKITHSHSEPRDVAVGEREPAPDLGEDLENILDALWDCEDEARRLPWTWKS